MVAKFTLFFLLFSLLLWAQSEKIVSLQKKFYDEVIVNHVYKKRFSEVLDKSCATGDKACRKEELLKLKNEVSLKEDSRLKAIYDRYVDRVYIDEQYKKVLFEKLMEYNELWQESQYLTIVDLSKQLMILLVWDSDVKQFYFIGSDLISSGAIEKEALVSTGESHYLKTPLGIFTIQSGWRSEGKTLEDNITLPYGSKDRFVFYFGKHKSVRYNTFDSNGTKIEEKADWMLIEDELAFAVHAHQSSAPLGRPQSHGCIRMTDELNLFLDNHLVLHKKVLEGKKWISKSANPPKSPQNYEFAGEYLIVIEAL